jgi:hypothetical protein
MKYKGKDFTLWDRIEIRKGDITLKELLSWLEENEGIEVDMIGVGSSLIFFGWMAPAKRKERMTQKLSGTIIFEILSFLSSSLTFPVVIMEEVTKAPLKSSILVATVTGTYEGEDIENMPDVYIYLS